MMAYIYCLDCGGRIERGKAASYFDRPYHANNSICISVLRDQKTALLEAAKAALEYVETSCGKVIRKQRLKEQLRSAIEQVEGGDE